MSSGGAPLSKAGSHITSPVRGPGKTVYLLNIIQLQSYEYNGTIYTGIHTYFIVKFESNVISKMLI